jgi:hypothetical protein
MIGALKRAYANFRGFDIERRAVPPMEGPLKPNTALDDAAVALTLPDVDNLVAVQEGLVCSTGPELLTLELRADPSRSTPGLAIAGRRTMPGQISCIASDGDALAIGLDGEGIAILGGKHDGRKIGEAGSARLNCATAAAFAGPDTLIVANGSDRVTAADWKRDLMAKGASGSVWRVDLGSGRAERIAAGLAFSSGLAVMPDGGIAVSEAWRHRVLAFDGSGPQPRVLLEDLPAYPGRIAPAPGGGFWLSLFAPRNALVEFVLTEDGYRNEMMANIDPAYWIAPSLVSGRSFLEPIQGGARKKLNMLKPWSPSWSYGLVAFCDGHMHPVASAHSRADGKVHGVTSLAERDGVLFAGAKGSGVIVALDAARMAGGAR